MTEAKPLTANSTVADWLTHHSGGLTDLDGAGHRSRTRALPENCADSHDEHLRQARRQESSGCRTPCPGTRPYVA